MSHGLEIVDGNASFAYNAGRGDPWHMLGTPVDGDMTIDEALAAAHANYTVSKQPLFGHYEVRRQPHPDQPATVAHLPCEVQGTVATMRENPQTGDKEVLGVVGSGYVVVQNKDVLERAYDIVGADADEAYVDTIGVLYGGRRFFSYINLGDLVIDPEGINDKIERGLAQYSSHDGTIAVTYAFTDIRSVCKNTVTVGVNGAQRVFRAKHTSTVDDRMATAQQILGVSTEWAKGFAKTAEEMLGKSFSEDRFSKVLDKVFPLASSPTERQKTKNADLRSEVRGLFYNNRNAGAVGKNGWAMYNAIVEFLDHDRVESRSALLSATMDPRDKSWTNTKKITAQQAVLALS